ncbi:AI-2E family transporter [Aliiglaciecola litoralis]|uniref:AI-2E family transporter n=1 Tax=Aliiglaciecola litoralis TaxID=582857 RepID=A0ABN1LEJ8_9ALTE
MVKQSEQTSQPNKTKTTASVYLRVLLGLAALYTLYLAQSLLIPIVFSVFIALLLSPLVRSLQAIYIPRPIAAFVLLFLLIAPFTFLANELAEPAEKWVKLLPKISVHLTEKIDSLSEEFAEQEQQAKQEVKAQKKEEDSGFDFFGWFSDDDEEEAPPQNETQNVVKERIKQGGIEVLVSVLSNAPIIMAQLLASIILIVFLLIYGPALFNVFVQDFPHVKNKQGMIEMVDDIQRVLSQYIATISVINALLGLATAAAFSLLGIQDALLWGALVAFFNFVPYVGSLFSLAILCLAGAVQFGIEPMALLPASVFIVINIIESQFVTPTVLGKRMQVNPLVIILWLLILGWLWGILGVLLAVPVLVCIKLVIERVGILSHWLKLIEA